MKGIEIFISVVFVILGLALTLAGSYFILSQVNNAPDFKSLFVLFFLPGIVFLALGVGLSAYFLKRRTLAVRLRQLGRKVEAHGVQVVKGWLKVNAKNSYRIICKWNDPMIGKERTFKSDLIWFNPRDQIKTDTISVFVDMADSRKYYVDISFLSSK